MQTARGLHCGASARCSSANKIAHTLAEDPRIKYVNYPSLETHPQHALAKRLLPDGCGAMLSFRVADDREKVNAFIRKLELVKYLGTLGGFRTSLAHPATAFRNEFTPKELKKMGMEEGLIRISAGIEDSADILDDIRNALSVFA